MISTQRAATASERRAAMADKPPYLSDEEWAEWLRDHPDLAAQPEDGKVVQFGQTRKRKPKPKPPPPGGWPPWLALCLVDEKGRILANLANAPIALRADSRVESVFTFDEMAQTAMLMRPLPVAPNGKSAGDGPIPRPAGDTDISQLQEWLQHQGLPRVGKETVHQAVDQRARERSFHPVRDWLNGLEWDGVDRLSGWLTTYLGADPAANGGLNGEDDPRPAGEAYLAAIGRMFLIAMVARIFQPGCKADYLLILEGEQGVEKSRACAALAGQWFSDSLPSLSDKDSRLHLRDKWLIEIAELAAFNRAETEALKAYITRTHERYRPPYGRKDVVEPRQCLFIGTTNRETYLKDETGGRRFWPVKTGAFDIEALERDRAQLFAQAVERYREDEHWWPDPKFEKLHIRPQQEARRDADAWEPKIADWLDRTTANKVLIWQVAQDALGIEPGRLSRADQNRIAGALITAEWVRARRTDKGKWWERKP
jgi:predicted P-loop ATPase